MGVVTPAEQLDGGPGQRPEASLLRPTADHHEPAAQAIAGLDGQVHALVRGQGRDDQVELAGRVLHPEAGDVHRRVDDVGVAAVGAPDPVGHEARDGHEVMHPRRGRPVPPPEPPRDRRHENPRGQARLRAEVVVVEIPDVAHRGEAVADVPGPGGNPHALGDRVARRQHQIVAGEVEALHRGREQRQVVAVAPLGLRQALDERGHDAALLDHGRDGSRHVQERVEVGGGKQLAEHLEAALAAAHAGEPIVDERDLRPVQPRPECHGGPPRRLRQRDDDQVR